MPDNRVLSTKAARRAIRNASGLSADPAKTAMRAEALRCYMDEDVLRPKGLCCPSHAACRESIREGDPFFEGRLSRTHEYIRICSPDRAELIMWCYTDPGGATTCHRTCDPMAP